MCAVNLYPFDQIAIPGWLDKLTAWIYVLSYVALLAALLWKPLRKSERNEDRGEGSRGFIHNGKEPGPSGEFPGRGKKLPRRNGS